MLRSESKASIALKLENGFLAVMEIIISDLRYAGNRPQRSAK